MQLHQLSNNKRGKKRIGRGGKRGTYSGRGTKGQRARSGHRIRPASRDEIMRLPKRKGYRNKRKTLPALALPLGTIQKLEAQKINPQVLLALRVLRDIRRPVKILSTGSITSAKEISGIYVSAGARAKIEKAGGTVLIKAPKNKRKAAASKGKAAAKKTEAKKEGGKKAPAKKAEAN